jgi:hypothetical protein
LFGRVLESRVGHDGIEQHSLHVRIRRVDELSADGLVAVAAAAHPDDAAPVEGSHFGNTRSTLEIRLAIDVDD